MPATSMGETKDEKQSKEIRAQEKSRGITMPYHAIMIHVAR